MLPIKNRLRILMIKMITNFLSIQMNLTVLQVLLYVLLSTILWDITTNAQYFTILILTMLIGFIQHLQGAKKSAMYYLIHEYKTRLKNKEEND